MANITYTKTKDSKYAISHKKFDFDSGKLICVTLFKEDNTFEIQTGNKDWESEEFSIKSTMQEFDELYLKAMIELGLIDCFAKLGFKMSPVVEQMTIAQWNERISKQAKP